MFSKTIYTTTLTNDVANRLFCNVTAKSYSSDMTFTATLRALLHKRLPVSEPVNLSLKQIGLSRGDLEAAAANSCMDVFTNGINPTDSTSNIHIVYAANNDSGKKMLELVEVNWKKHLKTYTPCEDLRLFYIKTLNGLFYVDEANKSTVIFLDSCDVKKYHALQMMIPKYLPWLFVDTPLSKKETALLKSLGNRSSGDYERIIEDFANDFDMRSEIIRSKLAGFETVFERQQINDATNSISEYERQYSMHLKTLQKVLSQINEQKILLAGLKCKVNDIGENSEIMDYFLCNKQLNLISVSGTEIEFVVNGYADVYDEEAFEAYVGSHFGYMYRDISDSITTVQMEKLYRAIFDDNILKLRISAAYRADMQRGITPLKEYFFPPESQTYLPNPHIQKYGCIGGYASRFQEYAHKHDYVGAIDQAVMSARNINWHDSTVINSFAHTLSCTSIKCIETPDGTLMSPSKAIKYLEKKGAEQECQDQS